MRKFSLLVVSAFVLATALVLAPSSSVYAQQGIDWTTGFQVQNLSASQASVTVTIYDENGAYVDDVSTALQGNSSVTFFPIEDDFTGLPSGEFSGSAIVSSDQPVSAILNIDGNGFDYLGSTTGISDVASEVSLPLIFRNNAGYSTWFTVQNAGDQAATVEIAYSPATGQPGNATTTTGISIPANASMSFDQSAANTSLAIGDTFIGSATVTSTNDQPLAVVVNQVFLGDPPIQLTYSGFESGATTLYMPLIQQANVGFFTGISIQNPGDSAATVDITFADDINGGTYKPADIQDLSVSDGGSEIITLFDGTNQYVGAATLTSDQPVIAIVNQLSSNRGTSYEALADSDTSTEVSMPLLMANNSNFFTGVQCQSTVETSNAYTLDYGVNTADNSPSPTLDPASATGSLGGDDPIAVNILQAGGDFGAGSAGGTEAASPRYIGNGTMTAADPVACVVNQVLLSGANKDFFLTYIGVPVPATP
jgi:uncharacterized protein (DUF2141 family)